MGGAVVVAVASELPSEAAAQASWEALATDELLVLDATGQLELHCLSPACEDEHLSRGRRRPLHPLAAKVRARERPVN